MLFGLPLTVSKGFVQKYYAFYSQIMIGAVHTKSRKIGPLSSLVRIGSIVLTRADTP